jgi:hypothetical protein
MSGQKGRSGRTSDPEARKQRALAGQKGGRATGGGTYSGGSGGFPPEAEPDTIDPERMPPDPGDNFLAMLPGVNPYDSVVAKTKGRFGYLDAKAREQSNGELLANEKRKQDLAITRRDLKTKDEFRDSITAITEEIVSRLSILVDAAVDTHPPEQQPRVRHLMEAAAYKLRDEVRAKLKEQAK